VAGLEDLIGVGPHAVATEDGGDVGRVPLDDLDQGDGDRGTTVWARDDGSHMTFLSRLDGDDRVRTGHEQWLGALARDRSLVLQPPRGLSEKDGGWILSLQELLLGETVSECRAASFVECMLGDERADSKFIERGEWSGVTAGPSYSRPGFQQARRAINRRCGTSGDLEHQAKRGIDRIGIDSGQRLEPGARQMPHEIAHADARLTGTTVGDGGEDVRGTERDRSRGDTIAADVAEDGDEQLAVLDVEPGRGYDGIGEATLEAAERGDDERSRVTTGPDEQGPLSLEGLVGTEPVAVVAVEVGGVSPSTFDELDGRKLDVVAAIRALPCA